MLLVIDCAAAVAWLFILSLVDRNDPDKRPLAILIRFFLVGFLSIIPTLLLSMIPHNLELGLWSEASTDFFYQVGFVGPIEEFSKFLVFFLFSMRWRSIHEPSDGMLQAGAVALAFATLENMVYAMNHGLDLLLLRSVLSTTGHVMLALVWGFGFTAVMFGDTKRRARDYLRVFMFIYPAALLHGVSNFLLLSGKPDIYFIFEAAVGIFALSLLLVARRRSPLRPMGIDEGKLFAREAEIGLLYNAKSFPLARRAAIGHLLAEDYPKARLYLDRCLSMNRGDVYCHALKGVVLILTGDAPDGEELLTKSYGMLSAHQQRTVERIARKIVRKPVPDGTRGNTVTEFLLDRFLKDRKARAWRRGGP